MTTKSTRNIWTYEQHQKAIKSDMDVMQNLIMYRFGSMGFGGELLAMCESKTFSTLRESREFTEHIYSLISFMVVADYRS